MTETPRTDELYGKIWLFQDGEEADEALCKMRDFARELERENARLREAGNAMRHLTLAGKSCSFHAAIAAWDSVVRSA